VLEDTRHEPVLPLIRTGGAREALDASERSLKSAQSRN
jgi:hypothetical protein